MVFAKKRGYEPIGSQSSITYQLVTRITLCCLSFAFCMILLLYLSAYCLAAYTGEESPVHTNHANGVPEHHGKVTFAKDKDDVLVEQVIASYNLSEPNPDQCSFSLNSDKFDCYPEDGGNEELCKARGCCWQPYKTQLPPLNIPWCFYPKSYGGYQYLNVTYSKNGVRAFLQRTFPSPYPDDVKLLRMEVQYPSSDILHVKILDADKRRYESPYPEVPLGSETISEKASYQILIDKTELGFKIIRNNGDIIFDAQNKGGFIYANQFLQISASLKGKLYGLGEHRSKLQLNTTWTRFTLFNHDVIPMENMNLYGSHPFYLALEPTGTSHGVFLLNSNAMDILLQPGPAITYRTIGGVFDFFFFMGPSPADVIRQYTEVIGRPFLPPYWSLGFHLSKLGYKDVNYIRNVWERTRKAGIPFDTQWNDIDYMESNNDFTYNKDRYRELPKFVKDVHDAGMHYIPILDPGVSGCESAGTYPPYDDGVELGVFVKSSDSKPFVGKVWNRNCTVFPDFTNPKTAVYWKNQIKNLHDKIMFDGLWLDMNEPSNFLDGSVNGCPNNSLEYPPYLPDVGGGKLFSKTICMSAIQSAGLHYDLHNLFGISEAAVTNRALQEILQKRPFIISRSTFPGIGRYAGHWSGDVASTWYDMKKTISELLSFSLFGVPMMGADICGFNGNTTNILCQRWSQLGAFYPFSRNHNTDSAFDQDPVALGPEVANSTRKALKVRYALLPYLYTLFWKAHIFGDTVARPLFFEFANDNNTHDIDESFLWGCCILIVPVLEKYATTVRVYLPATVWYDWYTGLGTATGSNGTEVVLSAPSDTIPILIRGGVILPTQTANATTTVSRLNKIVLIAATDKSMSASGLLYWDDGEDINAGSDGNYGWVDFELTSKNLSSYVRQWKTVALKLGKIKILGFAQPIQKVFFNGNQLNFHYNPTSLELVIRNLNFDIDKPFVLSWS